MIAELINNITKNNERCLEMHYIQNSDDACKAIVSILEKILNEAKNGLYELNVKFDFTSEEEAVEIIQDYFSKLAYNIKKSTYYNNEHFKCISLLISWGDGDMEK